MDALPSKVLIAEVMHGGAADDIHTPSRECPGDPTLERNEKEEEEKKYHSI